MEKRESAGKDRVSMGDASSGVAITRRQAFQRMGALGLGAATLMIAFERVLRAAGSTRAVRALGPHVVGAREIELADGGAGDAGGREHQALEQASGRELLLGPGDSQRAEDADLASVEAEPAECFLLTPGDVQADPRYSRRDLIGLHVLPRADPGPSVQKFVGPVLCHVANHTE